jgi:hypothetical protein
LAAAGAARIPWGHATSGDQGRLREHLPNPRNEGVPGSSPGVGFTGFAGISFPSAAELSLEDAAAGDATLIATLVVLVLALLVIVPAIAVLFRLTLEGRLTERFHPIVTINERGDR